MAYVHATLSGTRHVPRLRFLQPWRGNPGDCCRRHRRYHYPDAAKYQNSTQKACTQEENTKEVSLLDVGRTGLRALSDKIVWTLTLFCIYLHTIIFEIFKKLFLQSTVIFNSTINVFFYVFGT